MKAEDSRLFDAIMARDPDAVLAAIAIGANVDSFNDETMTPLMVAAKCQSPDIVDILLEHGADPTPKDKLGYNAASIAAWYGEYRMCAYTDESIRMQKRLEDAADQWQNPTTD